MDSSYHLSPKTLFRDEDNMDERGRSNSPPSSSDLNSSTDSGVVRIDRSPAVPVIKVRPVPRQDTPPYKKIRALRLFGSPQTPKTLLQRAEAPNSQDIVRHRSQLFDQGANVNPFSPVPDTPAPASRLKRPRKCVSVFRHRDKLDLSDLYDDQDEVEDERYTKLSFLQVQRIAKTSPSMSRYEAEFLELCEVGSGEFGSVYRCLHRLDGCTYAIKKSRKPMRGTQDEKTALNEVYAHAVLGQHPHVVRYYSAWAEEDRMIIQNEFCNGGSLADVIQQNEQNETRIPESELKRILLHVAEGLKYIHSQNLVHMDIKPGNIFITKTTNVSVAESSDDGFDEEDEKAPALEEVVVYKIGDLGHVTSTRNPYVEEGDCRYLAKEVLRDDYSHLTKADIFALGLTVFEAGGGGPLPKNGQQWAAIRKGRLPYLDHCSLEFNQLLLEMIRKQAEQRPSASALLQHPVLVPNATKSRAQLRKELNAERFKNELLSRKLEEASLCLQGLPHQCRSDRQSRLVGKKANRSHSVTNF